MMELEIGRREMLQIAGAAAMTSTLSTAACGQANLPGADTAIPVAFLLDQGATMIDFAGPWEVFQDSYSGNRGFQLFTVAPDKVPIKASGGMTILPDYALAEAPQPKVIVIPAQGGGRTGDGVARRVAWLRAMAPKADVVMSVCTGAFLLARTGLLDGLQATTHHQFQDDFASAFPKVKLVRHGRFVDNGKIITAGGLSSGIEAALHVVERYLGAGIRKEAADYMEYVPHEWTNPEAKAG